MNNDEIKALLEKNRAAIEKQDLLHQELAKKLKLAGDDDPMPFGPSTELEFQRVLKDIKDADNEE